MWMKVKAQARFFTKKREVYPSISALEIIPFSRETTKEGSLYNLCHDLKRGDF